MGIDEILGTYVYKDEKHDKFWKVTQSRGQKLLGQATVAWGRTGTRGSSQLVYERDLLKKVRAKLAKGYQKGQETVAWGGADILKTTKKVEIDEFDFMAELEKIGCTLNKIKDDIKKKKTL